jgi:hypothetical protein
MYEKLVEALRLCAKYGKAEDAIANAEKAADAIEELIPFKKHVEKETVLLDKAEELLNELKPRWIPVTERLPIRGDAVLCIGDDGISVADYVVGDKWCALPWFFVDGEEETGVTHWMPLPQPPKEET